MNYTQRKQRLNLLNLEKKVYVASASILFSIEFLGKADVKIKIDEYRKALNKFTTSQHLYNNKEVKDKMSLNIESYIERLKQKRASEDISNILALQKAREIKTEISDFLNELR